MIARSTTRGKSSEEIRLALGPGRYAVQVLGFAGTADERHGYQLKLQRLGR